MSKVGFTQGFRPTWWPDGQALLRADPVMAALMEKFPESVLTTRGAACETLVRAVVGQQISVRAADAIWQRFVALLGDAGVQPGAILPLTDETLRGVGLSFQKIKYIRGIAQGFVDGTVRPSNWADESDETIIQELVRLPGIGRWTAEMFLIFHLARPDVLPLDDLGLLKGFEVHYGPLPELAKIDPGLSAMKRWRLVAAVVKRHADRYWKGHRSLATWYLWRSLDPVEVIY